MPRTQLSWQPGFSLSRKPIRKPLARRTKRGASSSGKADGSKQFEFITEVPASLSWCEPRHSPSATPTHSGATIGPVADSEARANSGPNNSRLVSDNHGCFSLIENSEETEPYVDTPLRGPDDRSLTGSDKLAGSATELYDDGYTSLRSSGNATDRQHQPYEGSDIGLAASDLRSSQVVAIEPSSSAVLDLRDISYSPPVSMPPSILYSSLSERFKHILDRYNKEFCKIPLTSDLQINPFQYRTNLDPEPIFLTHAVMALAGHHVESTSTQNHRHAALQLLRESLKSYKSVRDGYPMLDTIIILFSLDETQSAFGNWRTHLTGAYGLLEACGGIKTWAKSARAEAQVGILTWWDAITSLVSREDCVFPYAYFDAVLSKQDSHEWDFYGLCGCPLSLVKIVMQLARISAEKRKSSSMRYVAFDTAVISELEQSLESWRHSPTTEFRGEECMQKDQDRMHCSEAWRNGLLVYIYRVFHWEPGSNIPMRILYRARAILDHVLACRDESMVSRQALLPLFFAGCELRDRSSRKTILKFCSVWNERTRYRVFSSAIPLLKDVWAEQETKGFENVWWGQIVDKKHSSQSCYPLQMRLCFG
ncbi:fungal-specific transcription factor domain-containing protein [Bisporella sp. PMI_857]|nr:fungal-specific transcription factor domain-containing protein [Bisporella sp. PMI_857]